MSFKTGIGSTIEINIGTKTTPLFKELMVLNIDESLNETSDEFARLSDNGFTQSVLTRLAPAYTLAVKYDDSDDAAVYLYENRMNIELRNARQFKITDSLSGGTVEFEGSITEISHTKEVDTITELSISVAMCGAPKIV